MRCAALRFACVMMGVWAAGVAGAQAAVKPDGVWHYAVGAGASVASGNSDSQAANVNAEAVRATVQDKWSLNARANYAKNDGDTTTDLMSAAARYDHNLNARWFAFGSGEAMRDRPANLSRRLSAATGLGYHWIKSEQTQWDLFAGVGYTKEHYRHPQVVADALRSRYDYAEGLFGQESTQQLTASTTFKQRLVVYPNASEGGEFRAVFDAGLSVAINKTLSLTLTVNHRYHSDPGAGLNKSDTLVVTGVSARWP